MTTPTRLANHGSTACAKGRPNHDIPPCTLPRCQAALARYTHRLTAYRNHPNARYDTIPAGPVTAHLRHLFAEGGGWTQISAAADCSTSTLKRLLDNPADIDTDAACRILALRPEDALAPCRRIPALGSIRRVRALAAIGHQRDAISTRARVANTIIGDLLNGISVTVDPRTAARITAAYERMRWTAGPSARMRNRARREGWATPLAWNGNIDDPDATPDVDMCSEIRPRSRAEAALIADEVQHLAGFGFSAHEIARRVDRSESYVHDQISGTRKPGWRAELRAAGEAVAS